MSGAGILGKILETIASRSEDEQLDAFVQEISALDEAVRDQLLRSMLGHPDKFRRDLAGKASHRLGIDPFASEEEPSLEEPSEALLRLGFDEDGDGIPDRPLRPGDAEDRVAVRAVSAPSADPAIFYLEESSTNLRAPVPPGRRRLALGVAVGIVGIALFSFFGTHPTSLANEQIEVCRKNRRVLQAAVDSYRSGVRANADLEDRFFRQSNFQDLLVNEGFLSERILCPAKPSASYRVRTAGASVICPKHP